MNSSAIWDGGLNSSVAWDGGVSPSVAWDRGCCDWVRDLASAAVELTARDWHLSGV